MWNRANIYEENKEKNMKMDQNKLFIVFATVEFWFYILVK